MVKSYQTIRKSTEGYFKEKGSRFISFAYPVTSRENCKSLIDSLKKKYHDARHHCFAFSIGVGHQNETRANDDGEPNHSAGDPILSQIKSFGLTDTLVVVVRYFGGTKLGVSGLIHAYKTAAEEALNRTEIITVEIKTEFLLKYPYDKTQPVLRLMKELKVELVDQNFSESCELKGKVDSEQMPMLANKLDLLGLSLD